MAPEKKIGRKVTTQHVDKNEENGSDNDKEISSLINEIESLKKVIAVKEDIIDDLTSERNQFKIDKDMLGIKYECANELLAESTKKVEELETERTRLKKEIDDLNDDVINSLLHEREEILELRKEEKKQLSEKIKELEKESESLKKEISLKVKEEKTYTDTNDAGDTNDTIQSHTAGRDQECEVVNFSVEENRHKDDENNNGRSKQATPKINEEPQRYTDSGIEIDIINNMKIELRQCLDGMIEEKLSELSIRRKDDRSKPDKSSLDEERFESTIRSNGDTKTDPIRDQNIIIHGVNERDKADTDYLKKLFDILGMGHTGPSMSHRLGTKKFDRPRPVQITMKSVEEKQQFMSKLGLLNHADDEFKNISITNDYTLEEREEIRRWVMIAKKRNTNENSNYVWKVRGTPKIGMRLIRIQQ